MKRVLGIVPALCLVALPAIAVAQQSESKRPPDAGTVTVPARGPGEDYKSNPAAPEQRPAPPAAPISEDERQAIFESIDPHDSPHVLVCVNDDGSGKALILEPAGPEAEAAPPSEAGPLQSLPAINDKGRCQ